MSSNSIIWTQIQDFLVEVGSSPNIDEFAERALQNIGRILPFDANAMFINADTAGRVSSWRTITDSDKWLNPFNNYYYRTMPDVIKKDVATMDWNTYQNREYATDFIKPQGIRYSTGVIGLGSTMNDLIILTLHRSKNSRQFNEAEEITLKIIQPHLTNLYRLYSKLKNTAISIPDAVEITEEYKCLSRREAEIVALLCRRYSTGMIESKLLISRMTVYKHIANIFNKLDVTCRDELLDIILGRKPDINR